eukprot:g8300.t1
MSSDNTPSDYEYRKPTVQAAPEVDTTGLTLVEDKLVASSSTRQFQDPNARQLRMNPKYSDLHAPIYGPVNPDEKRQVPTGMQNHWSGAVEDEHLDAHVFDEQYLSFHNRGFAYDPTGRTVIGDKEAWEQAHGESIFGLDPETNQKKRRSAIERKLAKQAKLEVEFDPTQPFQLTHAQPWAKKENAVNVLTEEQQEYMASINAERAAKKTKQTPNSEVKSIFHGKEDSSSSGGGGGRSWMEPPKDKKKENEVCFLPKHWIHTWSGHTKGVNAIQFFPETGQLLLSAGMDGRVKIWDVFNSGKCMRTYLGHSKGVRDIYFNNDGRKFLSTGYDCNIHLWDTETGQAIRTINKRKIFYVAKFHPDDNRQNIMLAGCSDKKIYQFDLDSGEELLVYDYHLDGVNTITFVDDGRRFVTSSDDKSLRIWEFGIPVQIKYIADPSMQSMPAITLHPSGNYFCGQSQDNQIVTYSTRDRFRLNRKKTFKGHTTAGYACQINFSPDGQYIISGDSYGRCFFWEWQMPKKVVRTFKAHEKTVCLGVCWHPLETSKVATCGWDGLIKYWD